MMNLRSGLALTLLLLSPMGAWGSECPVAASGVELGAREVAEFLDHHPEAEFDALRTAFGRWVGAIRGDDRAEMAQPLVRPLFRTEFAALFLTAGALSQALQVSAPQFLTFSQDLYETDWKDLNLSLANAQMPEARACLYAADQARVRGEEE